MFKWKKLGRVFNPVDINNSWIKEYAQAPSVIIHRNFIRVYFSCRPAPDSNGQFVSRLAYIDLKRDNLFEIINISKEPILSLGELGTFDEFGTYPASVIKNGNDILKLREMPADAVQDEFDLVFIYEKNTVQKEFPMSALPDSSWKYIDRKQTLVKKGKNNVPLINDFSLTDADGNDQTDSILNNRDEYYLVFIKDVPDNTGQWLTAFKKISTDAMVEIKKLYVITAQRTVIEKFMLKNAISVDAVLTCDATAIKTAARTNPTLYKMKGPVVQDKWGWADFGKVVK